MPRARSQVSPYTIWTVGFHVLLILGTLAILRSTWLVVTWILIATFIAVALDPAVRLVQRTGLPRAPAVVGVMLTVLGGFGLMVWSLVPMVAEQAAGLAESVPRMLARLQDNASFRWLQQHTETQAGAGAWTERLSAAPFLAVAGRLALGVLALATIVFLVLFMLLFGGELFDKAPRRWPGDVAPGLAG
jgi:predicted PurR-regulated permease PerM